MYINITKANFSAYYEVDPKVQDIVAKIGDQRVRGMETSEKSLN